MDDKELNTGQELVDDFLKDLPPCMDERKVMDEIFVMANKSKRVTKKEIKQIEEDTFKENVKSRLKTAREKKVTMKSTIDELQKQIMDLKQATSGQVKQVISEPVVSEPVKQVISEPVKEPVMEPVKLVSSEPVKEMITEPMRNPVLQTTYAPPSPPQKTAFQKMQEDNMTKYFRKYYNIKI